MVLIRECARGGKSALVGPLTEGRQYGSRKGNLGHSDVIGRLPRDRVSAVTKSGNGGQFMVHHPTLEEYVLLCNRRCTPIYPKDASAIISMLDASPGDRILEAGTGNAGLTMHLARAVGPSGMVHTAERSEATSTHAAELVRRFRRGQLLPSVTFHVGMLSTIVDDIALKLDPTLEEKLATRKDPDKVHDAESRGEWLGGNLIAPLFDGVVLDMPTPWTQLPSIFGYLKPDRYVVCYLPSMSQVMDLVRACRPWPLLVEDIIEVDWRDWEVRMAVVRNPEHTSEPSSDTSNVQEAMVCRPTHMPTGHTAFLVKLRKCASDIQASASTE
ncbi:hypothetical protein GGI12_004467 [Dipsacomyces acuminosporus]|nr:hypothetical protein GGI12_004467 [Dipsacomyces acuminosporus]